MEILLLFKFKLNTEYSVVSESKLFWGDFLDRLKKFLNLKYTENKPTTMIIDMKSGLIVLDGELSNE